MECTTIGNAGRASVIAEAKGSGFGADSDFIVDLESDGPADSGRAAVSTADHICLFACGESWSSHGEETDGSRDDLEVLQGCVSFFAEKEGAFE